MKVATARKNTLAQSISYAPYLTSWYSAVPNAEPTAAPTLSISFRFICSSTPRKEASMLADALVHRQPTPTLARSPPRITALRATAKR